ncbi:MAG: heavy-metal-associated domain-containing protein [Planctomycetota bacterium]
MTRRSDCAPNCDLLSVLDKIGYPGCVIPIAQTTLRIRGMEQEGATQRVQTALRRVRGVRKVEINGSLHATVTCDERRLEPADLVVAVRRAGFQAEVAR